MAANEQFNALYAVNAQAAQRYAAATMEGAQRVMRMQMDTTRELMERNGERCREALSRLETSQGTVDWPGLVQAQTQLTLDMTRSSIEAATRVYAEYVRAMQDQGRALTDAFQQTRQQGEQLTGEALRENERAAEEVGRRAAEAVSQMSGQVIASTAQAAQSPAHAPQAPHPAGEENQRRRNIIRP